MSSASPSHSPDVTPSQPSHPIPTKRSPLQRLRSRFPKLHAPTPSDTPTFKQWLRRCWLDILIQLLCTAVAFIIYLFGKPVMPRYFPLYPDIYTSPWGLRHGQPYFTEYISTVVSAAVSFFVPFLIMSAISGMHFDSFWDANAACMGLGYALSASTLFQSLVKWFIGGLRPHFLTLCKPKIPASFDGTGPGKMWYTDQVCTGDAAALRDAQMSFPSGHSSAAFAGFGFLALYFNAKFGILGKKPGKEEGSVKDGEKHSSVGEDKESRIPFWKLVLGMAPVVIAVIMAGSKVRDAWHHPHDVVGGAVIGTLFALVAWRMVYRSLWDQRTNHLAREVRGEKTLRGELTDKGYVV